MGQCTSFVSDCRERGCWSALFYTKKAPEWYRKRVAGTSSQDVHLQTAPKDSLLLVGYISLAVPDLETADIYWVRGGVQAGRSLQEKTGTEIRANVGPSQLRFPLAPGKEAQGWPGEITFWVEDIRQSTDMFNMLGRTLGTGLVAEYASAKTGGEFALKLHDAFHKNLFCLTEAPQGWAARLRAIGHDASAIDAEQVTQVRNPLALIDATVLISSRAVLLGVCKFYSHFLGCAVTPPGPTQYHAYVHFAPGEGLHQTLTFKEDARKLVYSNMGSICLYMRERHHFVLAYVKCQRAGLLQPTTQTREDVDAACEFRIRGCVDPESGGDLVPLEHVIRWAGHQECPLQGVIATHDTAVPGA